MLFKYSLRRLLSSIPTLLVLATLVFFLLRVAPGGPFDGERVFPKEVQDAIQAHYGLDQPLWKQYLIWLKGVLTGDLGESFQYIGRSVNEILSESLPPSVLLGLLALVLAIGLGIPLGVLAAWRQGTFFDTSAMFIAVSGVSLPPYLVASVLVLFFSLHLGWLPPALWEEPASLVLPTLTLALRPLAIVARLTRASTLETLSADFIRTAVAKGLATRQVLFKHALRNALIPVVTVLGPIGASLVTGSFLVEVIFQIPGLGKHFVGAVMNRDYPTVMGVTLTYGVVLVLANLAVDILVAWIDPRVRFEEDEDGV